MTPHSDVTPPVWAEALLTLVVARKDRDSVPGDLLEAYRDSVLPARGRRGADAWYVREVAGFVWRATWPWALLFSGTFIVRAAIDWVVPTKDFHLRSMVTTYLGVGTLLLTGFRAAWRSESAIAGLLVTIVTSQVAAIFSIAGCTVLLLALLRMPTLESNIAGSGGIEEAYVLPFLMIVPATILGTVSGVAGWMTRSFVRGRARRDSGLGIRDSW